MYFYMVVMHPAAALDAAAVQNVLNTHTANWYRFAPGSWVVVSYENAAQLNQWLQPFAQAINGNVLICRLDVSDRQGWMPQKFWDWLRQQAGF